MRYYDLTKAAPLWQCSRAVPEGTKSSEFCVVLIQEEVSLGRDLVVYVSMDLHDCIEAAAELQRMINAAKVLRGI